MQEKSQVKLWKEGTDFTIAKRQTSKGQVLVDSKTLTVTELTAIAMKYGSLCWGEQAFSEKWQPEEYNFVLQIEEMLEEKRSGTN